MTTDLQYPTPDVDREWANTRETHPAVAMAIHALSGRRRTPEVIWDNPTPAEWDNVAVAVKHYVATGVFDAEPNGRYPWGCTAITIDHDSAEV